MSIKFFHTVSEGEMSFVAATVALLDQILILNDDYLRSSYPHRPV
jgi:hypothetical protein